MKCQSMSTIYFFLSIENVFKKTVFKNNCFSFFHVVIINIAQDCKLGHFLEILAAFFFLLFSFDRSIAHFLAGNSNKYT